MSIDPAYGDLFAAATCSELRGWAQRTIEQWENHDRYRVPENEWPLYELEGHGRQPREVWIARGILASKPNIDTIPSSVGEGPTQAEETIRPLLRPDSPTP